MGTNQEVTYYAKRFNSRCNKGSCKDCKECKSANNKTDAVPKHRYYEARRVSRSILHEILNNMSKRNQNNPPMPCRVIRIKKEENPDMGKKEEKIPELIPASKTTSMRSLIIWNVTKALEINPCMDLQCAIRKAQHRVDSHARELATLSDQHPEQQHLVCAMLAWQQLGHHDAESLYRFIEATKSEEHGHCGENCMPNKNGDVTSSKRIHESSNATNVTKHSCAPAFYAKPSVDGSFGSHTSGPIVKLPVETKCIMRLETPAVKGACCSQHGGKSPKRPEKDTMKKIDAACCMESQCTEKLAILDATTKELRTRAGKLARREAERVELLERAEAAWKDLEIGYQRRLALAEEKEDDINKQIQKLIAQRNDFKSACTTLAKQLTDREGVVECERTDLATIEKQVCDRAYEKMRLSEEAAKNEAALAEQQCRMAQYDRDLQFKEEQARRKMASIENEIDSACALTCEAERAMRAELSALREQITDVSNELLQEDELNVRIKEELEQLRQEKMDMVTDLEGCKIMCDKKMQGRVNELKQKKEQLNALKEQVLECRCKIPVEQTVQVTRTPSLAAMCRCAPEDKLLESCSCTSMRERLLSNLLADLFGGLHSELNGSGNQMPCQLLKCLEDKHNWDRASVIKTNLRNFFSKLLMGELDIAIATAIEKYHAKWVGTSCADVAKMKPGPDDDLREGWQQRALEKRAQKMATQLAEQLFQERAEQLAQRAKEIAESGPPPCECKPHLADGSHGRAEAVFPCLMPSILPFGPSTVVVNRQTVDPTTPAFWNRTAQDVSQLKLQIEDLKKDSIKKEDLKRMEENIFKKVKQTSVMENDDPRNIAKGTIHSHGGSIKKETKLVKTANIDEYSKMSSQNKSGSTKKRALDINSFSKKSSINEKPTKQVKNQVHGKSYAVNICLCGEPEKSKNKQTGQINNEERSSWKQKQVRECIIPHSSIVKHTKPISIHLSSSETNENIGKMSNSCNSNCKCLNKVPTNTSIDKLLQTLTRWKYDLVDPQDKCIENIKSSFSKYSKDAIIESMSNQHDSKINLSISTESNREKFNESGNYIVTHMGKPIRTYEHPINTESEYMGAVNLDKSNDNVCKCKRNDECVKENNQEKYGNDNKNITFKCINTNACECKTYQEMKNKHEKRPDEEHYKVKVQSNHCQVTSELNENNNYSKSNDYVIRQKEMKRRSDMNNVSQKSEIFPTKGEYYIKFMGVTLDDVTSNIKPKRITKDIDNNADDFMVAKEKHTERRRTLPNKLSHNEPSDLLTKPNYTEQAQSGLINNTKCECDAQFEEFKSLINTFLTNNLHDITYKDQGLDSQSFKYTESTIESCVCCNRVNADDSKELEVNAFHLLEDHLKGKLEEFKTFSCQSACIQPEEEQKLFSAILQRVKQVISDCANETKCRCPGDLQNNSSWNRAYGLLQEYLKIKIKRVQCLCVLNNNKDVVLPDILEKVCKLIETDFQRLKDLCKCKNSNETRKKIVRIEDLVLPSKELPEKDVNTMQAKYYNDVEVQNVCVKLSKQNSNKSMILTENISSQVPPNLGMEAKSCAMMGSYNKNARTTETERIITNSKSNGSMCHKRDVCYNTEKIDIHQVPEMFVTREVLVNFNRNEVTSTDDLSELHKKDTEQKQCSCVSVDRVDIRKTTPKIEMIKNDENKLVEEDNVAVNEKTPRVPYIGYTVDCSCNDAFGPCVCMKSVVQANNNKIDSLWKEILVNNDNNQNFSYIMDGTHNKNSEICVQPNEQLMCGTEVVEDEDDVVLEYCLEPKNSIHHTYDESMSLGTSFCNSENPFNWYEGPVPVNSRRSNTVKLANSIYFPGLPADSYKKSSTSGTATDTDNSKLSKSCKCDQVPICHVKMLVENIEKNLIESKCTCDSLMTKVCPVHSKRVH